MCSCSSLKNQKDQNDFWHRKFTLKVQSPLLDLFDDAAKLAKASRDAYNLECNLIL